jgi:hypothetical protein
MNSALESRLQDEFPDMFKNLYGDPIKTCMAFGIECGDGWFELLRELCFGIHAELDKANYPEFTIDQVKEKFGTLRFYYSGYHSEEIDNLIHKAEACSALTCEHCGRPGKLSNDGWVKVRCQECK